MSEFLPILSLESLESRLPTQAFRLGKSIVSCGDVAGLKMLQTLESPEVIVTGYVHSEKRAVVWYSVSFKFNSLDGSISSPECVCVARDNMTDLGRPCKHISALLLAIIAHRDYQNFTEAPKIFRRSNMNRFAGAPPMLKDKLDYEMSWSNLLSQIVGSVPKKRLHSTSYNKLLRTQQHSKKKKKKDDNDLSSFTVKELQSKLRTKGLSTTGKKKELIDRLTDL
jgi:hypothetical protein